MVEIYLNLDIIVLIFTSSIVAQHKSGNTLSFRPRMRSKVDERSHDFEEDDDDDTGTYFTYTDKEFTDHMMRYSGLLEQRTKLII